MIKFEFTVTDEEADAIFEAIRSEIIEAKFVLTDPDVTEDYANWYRDRAKFLEKLLSKMKNTQV